MGHATTRATLILLQLFVAFTAIFGAVLVVPTLPLDWIKAGPLTDFTIPALVLGVLCGGAAAVAVVLLLVAPRLGGLASIVAGAFMIAFEVVEIAVVGFALTEHGAENPQSWLQLVYLVIGAVGMALGYHLWLMVEAPRQANAAGTLMAGERVVSRPLVGLLGAIAALVTVATGAGIVLRGNLATQPFTTVRGDVVDVLAGGIYRFNGKAIAAEGIGWDAVTLFLVVPALLVILPYLRRGSLRARLFAAGILVYFVYQYFEYATALAYGPMFAVYVGIVALSITGLALLLSGVDPGELRARVGERFPRRPMIGFGIFMAVLLGGMWLPLIVRSFDATSVPELNGGTTLVVQAFDLGLLVPLGLFTAATVARGLVAGYILSAIVVVKAMAMGAGIAAMLVVEWSATGVSQLPPIIIFALISIVAAFLAIRVYGSIGAPEGRPAGAWTVEAASPA